MSKRRAREPAAPPGAEAAMEIAVRFLGARPRTRWELERRLRRARAEDSVVGATLERLAELGYVDDAAFARWWAEQRDRHAPRGRRLIEAELRRSGVPREVIEAHRDEHDHAERAPEDAELPATDAERARNALERHLRGRPFPDDPKALQRLGMFLVRRGFDPETVRSTLREVGHDPSDAVTVGQRTNNAEDGPMATSDAATPDEYIASLPDDRREAVATVVDVIRRNLPPGYEEGMAYGMIGWWVPLERFPNTYNGQPLGLAGIASQKNYVSLYLNTVYGDPDEEKWFRERYASSGKKLNMGKSCVRFRRLEEVPLDVIGETIARADLDEVLARYEARGSSRRMRAAKS